MRRGSFEAFVGQLDQLSPQQRVSLLQAVHAISRKEQYAHGQAFRYFVHQLLNITACGAKYRDRKGTPDPCDVIGIAAHNDSDH